MTTRGEFEQAGASLGELVAAKNEAYGDSARTAESMLGLLYPSGVRVDQYRDMLLVVRVLDKLSRVSHKKDAFGESPWGDIAGYGLLGATMDKE